MSQAIAIVVTDFHRDAYNIAMTGARANMSMGKKLAELIHTRYGDTSPTFEQYREDQAALRELAKVRKLADNQWVRKPYAAAIKARFGKLPVSLDPAAVLKAAKRAADAAAKPKAAGAPAGATQDHGATPDEQIDALVTRVGIFKMLEACTRILAADDLTKGQAAHIGKMAAKAAELVAKNGFTVVRGELVHKDAKAA